MAGPGLGSPPRAAGAAPGPRPLRQLITVCTLRCFPLEMLTRLFSVCFDVLIGAIR